MGMSAGSSREDEPMMEMNMTPLIDVLLVLLVMFIITIPVMTHAVKLDMPRATNAPSQVLPVVINLEIDFDGTILWNGTPVPDFDTLDSVLPSRSRRSSRSPSCTSVRASGWTTTWSPGSWRPRSATGC